MGNWIIRMAWEGTGGVLFHLCGAWEKAPAIWQGPSG